MGNQSLKLRNILIMLTLSLSTIALMGDMVIIPVAGNIYSTFSDANIAVLNFILSGPALIGAFSALLCGKLMYHVSKKVLLIITFFIFMIGSICGGLIENVYYMLAMRVLVGVGMGAVNVLALSIIADVFIDEKTRGSMIGIFNGLMAAVGAALGWVSGIVAISGWTHVFKIYLVAIPIFLMITIFIPKEKKEAAQESDMGTVQEKMPWKKLLLLDGAFLIYNIVYCIIYFQISMVIGEKGIGDVSYIGLLSALGTVGSFLACCSFGYYFNKLKRFTPFIGFVIMALSYTLLYFTTNSVLAAVACTFLGSTFGLGISYYMMYCTVIVPTSQIPMAISVTTTVMSIGTFLSTYVSTLLQKIMGVSTLTEIIPVLIVVLVIGAVLSAFSAARNHKEV